MDPSRWKQRWVLSYIFDYLIVIIFILGFSALDLSEPYHQRFSLNNESLQYPFADPERISVPWAGVICCLFPVLCIVFWTMLIDGQYSHHKRASNNRSRIMGGPWTLGDRLWEMNSGILGLGLSVAGAICITGALKNATGKPRPDIIARCIPKLGSKNMEPFGLVNPDEICTQTNHKIYKDGFRSWPSGHSSVAFAGLGYLSLFLAGKLHIMDNRGEVWKTVLVLVPLLAAALVAVSRIMDARHHPFDVITGSMLGQTVAWIAYRQYFPAITEPSKKGRAYPRRTWGTNMDLSPAGLTYTNAGALEEGSTSTESLESEGQLGMRKRAGESPFSDTRNFPESAIPLQHRNKPSEQAVSEHKLPSPPPPPPPPSHQTWPPHSTQYRVSVDMGDFPRGARGSGDWGGRPPHPAVESLEDVKLV